MLLLFGNYLSKMNEFLSHWKYVNIIFIVKQIWMNGNNKEELQYIYD